ncbi:hypothetical protein MUN89_12015 [Halobacillus salinarum]|uniref:FMN-dependent dehydrogenase domain-containing protein n=1 Tax=Halobacillus salinarum TaxID=2932257 RepID=A0ABY4EE11_9BACI|nr:hypothetical protein [Halobacillus salinarum]UOQ42696.1 hypothetical protein MUN89_12015 [Halobacillus salinarum]
MLGAQAFGMAGGLLRLLVEEGKEKVLSEIAHIHYEIQMGMMLLNARKISELSSRPYVQFGRMKEWLDQRI